MGLLLDSLANVNEAKGLHGTAADPSNGIGGGFNRKDYHLVNKGFWFIGGHTPSPFLVPSQQQAMLTGLGFPLLW